MNKEEFDQLFDEAFDKMGDHTSDEYSADYRPSWKKVKRQIRAREKRHTHKTLFRNIFVIAASMLLGAVIFGGSPNTKAFNPFYQKLKEMPGDMITLFFGNKDATDSGAKTTPPTSGNKQNDDLDLGKTNIKSVTIEEAREKASFKLPVFDYIPTGYKLQKTELFSLENEAANKVRFTFKSSNHTLWVTIRKLKENTTVGSGANAKVEVVQLKHGDGFLTISNDGTSQLEFINGNVYTFILGHLTKDELIRFADHM